MTSPSTSAGLSSHLPSFSSVDPSPETRDGQSSLRALARRLTGDTLEREAQRFSHGTSQVGMLREDPISQALANLPTDTVVRLGRRGDIVVSGAGVEDFHATLTKKDGFWIVQDGAHSHPSQQGVSIISGGVARRIHNAHPVFPGEELALGATEVRIPPCPLSPFPAGLSTFIGRGERNTILIPENAAFVSRGHCTIERKGSGEYLLSDGVGGVASRFGTEVKDADGVWARVEAEQVQIVPGQEFRLGGRYVFALTE